MLWLNKKLCKVSLFLKHSRQTFLYPPCKRALNPFPKKLNVGSDDPTKKHKKTKRNHPPNLAKACQHDSTLAWRVLPTGAAKQSMRWDEKVCALRSVDNDCHQLSLSPVPSRLVRLGEEWTARQAAADNGEMEKNHTWGKQQKPTHKKAQKGMKSLDLAEIVSWRWCEPPEYIVLISTMRVCVCVWRILAWAHSFRRTFRHTGLASATGTDLTQSGKT